MPITINGNGTVTGISVGGLPDGIVDTDTLAVANRGKVLQVKQTVLSSTVTVTDGTETELMNVAITPTTTSSKILVCINSGPSYTADDSTEFKILIYRDSTVISGIARYFGSGGSNHPQAGPNGMYLDSPSISDTTTAITYRAKLTRVGGSGNCVYNHTNSESKSSITVMEIAG